MMKGFLILEFIHLLPKAVEKERDRSTPARHFLGGLPKFMDTNGFNADFSKKQTQNKLEAVSFSNPWLGKQAHYQ